MKFRVVAIVALWVAMFAGSNAEARGPYGSINVGNWKGGAYTNDQTGAFTHCSAEAGGRHSGTAGRSAGEARQSV
jgi:hypothetical protein